MQEKVAVLKVKMSHKMLNVMVSGMDTYFSELD